MAVFRKSIFQPPQKKNVKLSFSCESLTWKLSYEANNKCKAKKSSEFNTSSSIIIIHKKRERRVTRVFTLLYRQAYSLLLHISFSLFSSLTIPLKVVLRSKSTHTQSTCLHVCTSHCLNSTQSSQCKVTYPRAGTDSEWGKALELRTCWPMKRQTCLRNRPEYC